MHNKDKVRCIWVNDDPLYIDYHDNQWGVPIYDDQLLFEFLILEGMQAGLSWITILKKRKAFQEAFDHFNVEKIASYDQKKIQLLLNNPNIIRNRLKINSVIKNAQSCINLTKSQTLSSYLWSFVDGKPLVNHWGDSKAIPAETKLSQAMSKDLKRRGFSFVGPTICYSLMQATGMVNDHTVDCFRHQELINA